MTAEVLFFSRHLFFFLSFYESWFLCSIICQAVCRLSVTALLSREPGGRWGRGGLPDPEVGPGSLGSLWQRWRSGKREQGKMRRRRRRKVSLITSCIFKQAHSPCGEESSIFGGGGGKHVRKRKTRGDRRVGKKRGSWLVKWRLGAAGLMQEG